MGLAKIRAERLLDRLPDGVSLEDIAYHVFVLSRIENGLEALRDGRLLSQEEVERRVAEWLPKA